jgi:hypothetical protein
METLLIIITIITGLIFTAIATLVVLSLITLSLMVLSLKQEDRGTWATIKHMYKIGISASIGEFEDIYQATRGGW